MKLSIILPIYKVETYLSACIESILSQSYKDYEIILVDDGSPDNCGKICDEYKEKYSNIKVVHKQNGGLSSARNAGMEVAEGDFLLFLDADDFLEAESLMQVMNSINDNEADLYTFAHYNYYENGEKELVPNISDKYIYSINDFYKEMISVVGYFRWEVWRYLYKRSIVEKNNLKARIEAKITEDCDFTNKYLQKIEKIYSVNIPVVNYRYSRPGSATTQKEKFKCFDEIRNCKEHYDFYSKNPEMDDVSNYFEKIYYSKLKKLLILFELDNNDIKLMKKYKISPKKFRNRLINIITSFFGYKITGQVAKTLKKIKQKINKPKAY